MKPPEDLKMYTLRHFLFYVGVSAAAGAVIGALAGVMDWSSGLVYGVGLSAVAMIMVLALREGSSGRPAARGSRGTTATLEGRWETKIRDLAGMVSEAVGYKGETVWDTSRPDGQPVRYLDVSRARERIGFEARVPLEEGLRRTVESFRSSVPQSA